jgi:predicted PurR-regulated permease PerM
LTPDSLETGGQVSEWRLAIWSPQEAQTVFQGILCVLAVLVSLYIAQDIVLPVVLAFVLKLLLQPLVSLLERLRVPKPAGALIGLALLLSLFVGLGMLLSSPAARWASELPQAWPQLQLKFAFIKDPVEHVRWTLKQMGVQLVLPTFAEKREAVAISLRIERDLSAYLLTITIINAVVGCATAGVMWLCDVPGPVLWGVVAFCLNFVPILGPFCGIILFLTVGLISKGPAWAALLPAALYLGIHVIEGEIVTPVLLASRFTINPVAVILSLIFWYWMWGVPGAILAVPILAIIKIVCDRLRPLRAFGHLLEG